METYHRCLNCKYLGIEGEWESEYGQDIFCLLDYHDIESPMREICDKWVYERGEG